MSKNMAIVLRWSAFFGCCMGIVYCWAWDAIEQIVEGPLYTSDADLSYQIGICLASGFVWALIFMISLAAMWRVLRPSSPPRIVLGCVSLIALFVQVAAFASYDLLVTRLDMFPRIYDHVDENLIDIVRLSIAIVPALLAAYITMLNFGRRKLNSTPLEGVPQFRFRGVRRGVARC